MAAADYMDLGMEFEGPVDSGWVAVEIAVDPCSAEVEGRTRGTTVP